MSKILVGTWLEPRVATLVRELAVVKGISVSEHVRSLILQDLDRRIPFQMSEAGARAALASTLADETPSDQPKAPS